MKKLLTLFVALTILFVFFVNPINGFAASAPAKQVLNKTTDIKFTNTTGIETVTISTASYTGYKVFYLPSPDRYVIDIPNNILSLKNLQAIKANGQFIQNIRFSQFTANSVRVVLDVSGTLKYSIDEKKGMLSFVVSKSANNVSSRGDVDRTPAETASAPTPVPTSTPTPAPAQTAVPTPADVVTSAPSPSPSPAPTTAVPTPTPIPAQVPTVSASPAAPSQPAVNPAGNEATYTPAPPPVIYNLKNFEYSNINGTVNIKIKGIAQNTGYDFNKLNVPVYKDKDKSFTLYFPTLFADLDNCSIRIDDGIVESISILNDLMSMNTFITITTNKLHSYNVVYNQGLGEAVINLTDRISQGLVVLDPGHGGSDPGANYGNLLEKDINLKIALKVDQILRNNGVKTYLTRKDDTYVSVYDRAKKANDLNATLFLSIHNNAFTSNEYGTETLYYPVTGSKQFAQTIQDSIVSICGTHNRGIVQRPNLVVLNSTKMTAALAEVAFITNPDDRAKLTNEEFINKVAVALSEAVMKTLATK